MRIIAVFLLTALMSTTPGPQQGPPPPDTPGPIRVTDRARPDFGYKPWAGSDVTVVVVFSVECVDCVASVPFYRRLKQRIGDNTDRKGLVFLTQDGVWPAFAMLKEQGVDPRQLASYPPDDRFDLKGMPTLLLFGADWQRVGEWRGRLDSAGERAVLAAIDRLIADAKREGDHE